MEGVSEVEEALPPNAVVRQSAGRDFAYSPDWDCSDARIVFDKNSGDYWVVSGLSAAVLSHSRTDSGVNFQQLVDALADRTGYFSPDAALSATIRSLVDNGLLQFET